MKDVASWALNTAALRGASYADVRLADDRHRGLSTKNGKVGSASVSESFGFGVRVIAGGAWGFAASDDLSRAAVEATAGRAVEIAKASSRVKQHDIQMAPEKPVTAEWTSPFQIDPFVTSEGADIHQTKFTTGVGYAAHAFAGSEIQKRSYPNSYGGQWQNKGYELIEELKLVENARRVGEEAVALL